MVPTLEPDEPEEDPLDEPEPDEVADSEVADPEPPVLCPEAPPDDDVTPEAEEDGEELVPDVAVCEVLLLSPPLDALLLSSEGVF
jgi:hypothetical protein